MQRAVPMFRLGKSAVAPPIEGVDSMGPLRNHPHLAALASPTLVSVLAWLRPPCPCQGLDMVRLVNDMPMMTIRTFALP